ncbi:8-oxo-dGDP phosphatase NUDT18 isoform X1 [Paramisgurnus dabryanus]|uniref:8-oxo-dGDP phosphatase NUDT18 isoform X1 n=2 Tax=Paramisgurnus dabryanus TaxID=90735 RepID=UPI0031F3ECB3
MCTFGFISTTCSIMDSMGILEEDLEKILMGGGLEVREFDSANEVQPVTLGKDVCYIVCAVIFNSKDEVLMVQEAKRECYGTWYLPAGRMERGESIIEALQREVKEEAGVDCQPITMLLVQEQGPQWIRFIFLADVTGGSLKTKAEADEESLQAQWWDRESHLPLRKRDILSLIDAGIKYRQNQWFPALQPVDVPCHVICQRLLLAFMASNGENSEEERVWLLLSNGKGNNVSSHPCLPVRMSGKRCPLPWSALRMVNECMSSSYDRLNVNMCGILGVQHNGRVLGKTDGICFNTLVLVKHSEEGPETSNPPTLDGHCYRWHELTNQSMRVKILQRIKEGTVLPVS